MTGWMSRLFGGEGFSVSVDREGAGFTYRERGRRMRILGETMPDGYAVYASSIRKWENRPNDVIDEAERQRIASNVHQYLTSRGQTVYLS